MIEPTVGPVRVPRVCRMPAGVMYDDLVEYNLSRVVYNGLLEILAGRHVPYDAGHQLLDLIKNIIKHKYYYKMK